MDRTAKDLEEEFSAVLDGIDEIAVSGKYSPRRSPYSFLPPCDEDVLAAYEEKLGHALPPDLLAFARQTRGYEGREFHLEEMRLSGSPDEVQLSDLWFGVENAIRFGRHGTASHAYIEVGRERCRVWYDGQHESKIVLLGRSLLDFFRRRLAHFLRLFADDNPAQVEQAEEQQPQLIAPDTVPKDIPEDVCPEFESRPLDAVDVGELDESTVEFLETLPELTRAVDFRGRDLPIAYKLHSRIGCRGDLIRLFRKMTFGLFGEPRIVEREAHTAEWMKFGELFVWIPSRA